MQDCRESRVEVEGILRKNQKIFVKAQQTSAAINEQKVLERKDRLAHK